MHILCLLKMNLAASFLFGLLSLSVSVSESSHWKAHTVEGNVQYTYDNKTMFPLRFKTVDGGGAMKETCTTFYYNDSGGMLRWGQLRWSEDKWGVELFACTDNKLSTIKSGDRFTNVPEGPERIWEISWDQSTLTVKCNEVEVWKFRFADQLPEFSDEVCGQIYGEKYGPLQTFVFNTFEFGKKKVSGLNIPIEYYSYSNVPEGEHKKSKNRKKGKKKKHGNKRNKKNKGVGKKTRRRKVKVKKNQN